MARQPLDVETIEAFIKDLDEALVTLRDIVKDMRESGVEYVYGHAVAMDTVAVPRVFKFSEDLRTQYKIARKAHLAGREDPAVSNKERSLKEVERRKKRSTKPDFESSPASQSKPPRKSR